MKAVRKQMPSSLGQGRVHRRRIQYTGLIVAAAAVVSIMCGAGPACAAPREEEVKAAFLLNFANFVTWPVRPADAPEAPFVIAIEGDADLLEACTKGLSARSGSGGPMSVAAITAARALDPAGDVKILYLESGDRKDVAAIIRALAGRPVLLVSDFPGFAGMGGGIGLVTEGGQMSFEINRRHVEAAGLKVSSRLMRVARKVIE